MAETRSAHEEQAAERRREANTMALYIAICLLAALTALPDSKGVHAHGLGIIWGITVGLAVAHWFAFWVATRLVSGGEFNQEDVNLAVAQLTGAGAVALLASVSLLLCPDPVELNATELVLAAFVGGVGYLSMRWSGAGRARAVTYAAAVVGVAVVVVELKNWLAGY